MRSVSEAGQFRKALARWFSKNGRDLPWRRTRDPYAVAVSEFMLQQTTVAAVQPYYARWIERFPSWEVLAAASEDEVLGLWQGLGYYSRARNLLGAARVVCASYGGSMSGDPGLLRGLPGFGPYTAGAVAAFAFDRPVEVVDANIARVLARLGNVSVPIDTAAGREAVSEELRRWMPTGRTGGRGFISALMDLGSAVCRPVKPSCEDCPVRGWCRGVDPGRLPVKKAKPAVTQMAERRAIVLRRGRVGLVRSQGPWWRGLWLLPTAKGGELVCREVFAVTRFRVIMEVVHGGQIESGPLEFFEATDLPPMPSPHARAVAAALDCLHNRSPDRLPTRNRRRTPVVRKSFHD